MGARPLLGALPTAAPDSVGAALGLGSGLNGAEVPIPGVEMSKRVRLGVRSRASVRVSVCASVCAVSGPCSSLAVRRRTLIRRWRTSPRQAHP